LRETRLFLEEKTPGKIFHCTDNGNKSFLANRYNKAQNFWHILQNGEKKETKRKIR